MFIQLIFLYFLIIYHIDTWRKPYNYQTVLSLAAIVLVFFTVVVFLANTFYENEILNKYLDGFLPLATILGLSSILENNKKMYMEKSTEKWKKNLSKVARNLVYVTFIMYLISIFWDNSLLNKYLDDFLGLATIIGVLAILIDNRNKYMQSTKQ